MKLLKIFAATLLLAGAALYLTIANAESYDFPAYSEQAFNQADTTVLVDVYAPWCSTCRAQSKALNQLSVEYPHIKILRIDYDSDKDFAMEKFKAARSTLILFKAGKEIDRLVAVKDPAAIKALLAQG